MCYMLGLLFSVLLMWPTAASASALSNLANSMSPGEWAELTTIGLWPAIEDFGTDHTILSDQNEGHYDSVNEFVYIIGGDHSTGSNHYMAFITYKEATNTWTKEFESTPGAWGDHDQHAYDELWIDTVNQRFGYSTKAICNWPCSGKTQGQFSILPTTGITFSARGNNAYEYFPTVGLIRQANWNLRVLRDGGSSWELLFTLPVDPQIESVMEYNPVHREVLFGGGSNNQRLWTLDENENITEIAVCPEGGCHVATSLIATAANGDYIFVGGQSNVYKYTHADNKWTFLENHGDIFTNRHGTCCTVSNTIAINIFKHQVTMFVQHNFANSKVFLYKHSDTVPMGDTSPPTSPTGLNVQ